jgi:hypothetical protein
MAIATVMTRPRLKRYRSVPARTCWPLTISKLIRVKIPYWMARVPAQVPKRRIFISPALSIFVVNGVITTNSSHTRLRCWAVPRPFVARLRPRPPPGQRSGGCCSDPSGWLREAAASFGPDSAGSISRARPRTRRQRPESRCHCDNRAESWTQSRSSPPASAHADQNPASVSARR